ILDLSKIEADKLDVEIINMSPCQLAKEVEMMMSVFANDKGLDFKLTFEYPLPQQIMSDSTRLKQIIINLCNNAIKFTHKGHVHLTMSYKAEQRLLCCRVTDTGIGLTDDQKERIFTAFEQADSSTTRKYGGTGLGLYISQKLAEMLGGNIEFSSVFGQGTSFDLQVDVGKEAHLQLINSSNDLDEVLLVNLGRVVIPQLNGCALLVEDGIDNQKLIKLLLEKTGLTVEVADNGQIALEKASLKTYDVILMDMHMPIMDGLEATKLLIDGGYKKPIIALTGSILATSLTKIKKIGCCDIVEKPIEKAKFYEMLKKHINSEQNNSSQNSKRTAKSLSGHILIVEDNVQNQKLMAMFLTKQNLTYEIAVNGELGVEKALTDNFDLILMDMQMPIMGGVKATNILRESGYKKPIIACTANVSKDEVIKYKEIGCDALISKPFDRQFFIKIINDFLQNTTSEPIVEKELSANILICDEQGDVFQKLTDVFKATKLTLEYCDNSEELVNIVLSTECDFVMINHQQSGTDKAVSMLRLLGFENPILIIADESGEARRQEFITQGFNDLLIISNSHDDIIKLVKQQLQPNNEINSDNSDIDLDETIKVLNREFVARLPQIMDTINILIKNKNWNQLAEELHTLKGTAGNFGFHDLTELAKKAEHFLKQNDYLKSAESITELSIACHNVIRNNA
ncbi:MAG: response regulator, partial [Methylococcales bacterium]|nr:response regulator [Methylococcales bacterium]